MNVTNLWTNKNKLSILDTNNIYLNLKMYFSNSFLTKIYKTVILKYLVLVQLEKSISDSDDISHSF